MIDAKTIAILDLLHAGYHPPRADHPDHVVLMAQWAERYRVRLACAARMLEAVAAIDREPDPDTFGGEGDD